MAEKKIIEIDAKTRDAQKEIEDLSKKVDNLGKSQEQTAKATTSIATSIGTLTKGAIIGIAIKAFEAFTEVLNNNQKVADFFSTALEFVSIAFNDLVNFIINNTGPVVDTFKSIFNDPVGSIKDLGNAIKDNIIERFNSLLDTLGFVGDAISKFITGDFEGAKEAAISAGKELVDVYTGVDNSVDKLGKVITEGAEAVKNYTKETYSAAQSNVELAKTAERASALNQGLIEQYDRQAEKLRQVRDEERNTLEERIAANNELKEVLDQQEEAMLANANAILQAAQAQYDKNNSQENEIALIEARNELLGVQAQIEGFRSEQLSNDLALSRELAQLDRDRAEAAINAYETERRAAIEGLETEGQIAEATLELEEELFNRRMALIDERLNAEKEGSVAYQEILNERLELEAEYGAVQKEQNQALSEFNISLKEQEEQAKLDILNNALGVAAQFAEEGSDLAKGIAIAQATINTYQAATNALANTPLPPPFPQIAAGVALASGLAQVRNIINTDVRGTTTPSISTSTGSAGSTVAGNSSSPQFNVVAAAQQNALLNDINQSTSQPMRAFVVSKDVSTAQELERNRIRNATL